MPEKKSAPAVAQVLWRAIPLLGLVRRGPWTNRTLPNGAPPALLFNYLIAAAAQDKVKELVS